MSGTGLSSDISPYMNTRIFDRQLVFSVNMDAYDAHLREILRTGIGRYDSVKGNAFFFIMKGDPMYPELRMRVDRTGYRIRESDSMLWFRVGIPSFTNENVSGKIQGKPFALINDAVIYPFTVYRDGRLYYIVQYRNEAEEEISERILSSVIVYGEVYGYNALNIESIGPPAEIPELIRNMGISMPLSEIDLSFRPRSNPGEMPRSVEASRNTVKWPFEDQSSLSLKSLGEALYYVDMPEQSIREIHDSFIRRVISSLYFEVIVREDVTFRIVTEEILNNDIFTVLAQVHRNGGMFILKSVRSIQNR